MRLRRLLASALPLPLAITLTQGIPTQPAIAAPAAPAAPAASQPRPKEAADIRSARVAAKLSGLRVEALSERTEDSTTWANPDGSLTSELAGGPVRFKRDDKWVDVDVTFNPRSDGSVESRAHPLGLHVAGGTGAAPRSLTEARATKSRDFLTLGEGDGKITLGWRGNLPNPVADGATATYVDAVPGADLVVEATRTGFEQFVRVNQRPASTDFSYTLPLKAPGLKLTQNKDGGVDIADRKTGKLKAVMPAPVMWDAATDPRTGERTHTAPVGLRLAQRGAEVDLLVTPDAKFLADPATKYPVTVDPSTGYLGNVFDTYVQRGVTTDLSSATELLIGYPGSSNSDGTTKIARSFITWNTAPIADSIVQSARLSLYNNHSWTCQARQWQVWPADQASTSTRWANQPAMLTDPAYHTSTETRGHPDCNNDGYVNADITNLVSVWAGLRSSRSGMGLKAGSETDTTYWKRFNSGNAASNIPKLLVTYNYRPGTAKQLQAGPPYFLHGSAYHVNSVTPTLRYTAGDTNNDKVQGTFEVLDASTNALITRFTSPWTPAGQTASGQVPAGLLTHGKTYKFRVVTYDGTHWDTIGSAYTNFVVDTAAPSAPASLTSTDYPTGQWVRGAGQAGSFTATPPAGTDHQWLEWSLDGITWNRIETAGRANPVTFSVTPAVNGTHGLQVRAVDKADNASQPLTYTFHAGPGGFLTPSDGQRTARRVVLAAESDGARFDRVSFSWRRSSTEAWAPIPLAHVTDAGQPVASWPVPLTNGKNAPLTWNVLDTVSLDGNIELKADFIGPGGSGSTQPLALVVDRNAPGAEDIAAGPGRLNLLTGDFELSGSEATFFGMSMSRTASSRSPAAGVREGQVPIFGPQWVAGIVADRPGAGYTHLTKTSATSLDVIGEDGTPAHFTAGPNGTWVGEPGSESATLTGSFTGQFQLTDAEGNVVTFAKVDPAAPDWQVTESLIAGLDDSTTKVVSEKVVVDGKTMARPKRIIAPTSAVDAATCLAAMTTKGCRALELIYATTTTATPSALGDFAGRVVQVKLWATSPGASGATATTVAQYAYDDAGRLREDWDPRTSPALKTAYTYDAAGRVLSLTPPGQLPWTFTYGNVGGATGGDGMLLKVSRPTLRTGTADQVDGTGTLSVVYNVPLSGARAPYALGASDVRNWGQTDLPTDGTAIFPPDAVPASHHGPDLDANGYKRALVYYLNASGAEVNTSDAAGNIATTEHDRFGNVVRELTAANRARALGMTQADRDELVTLGLWDLTVAQRAELLSTRTTFDREGNEEREVLGPIRTITLANNLSRNGTVVIPAGTAVIARSRTLNEYDVGRPTDGSANIEHQITKETAGAELRQFPGLMADARVSTIGYDWEAGLANLYTHDPAGLAISRRVSHDDQGRVTRAWQPKSADNDAGTTVNTYYTGAGSAPCGGRPEWEGLLCSTGPGGDITGGGSAPAKLPTKTYEYGRHGERTKETTTANGVTTTSTLTYDDAGRQGSLTVTSGIGTAAPVSTSEYDPVSGLLTRTTSPTGGTITRAYDKLGRLVSYTDADAGVTTTTYDSLNRIVQVSDSSPSTVAYSYDLAIDPRGLPTGMTDSVAGVFGARYDRDGDLAEEKLPGGFTVRNQSDPAGAPTSRTYTRDSDGTVVMSDAVTSSVHGQWLSHTGVPGELSTQRYRYDSVGRLVEVNDVLAGTCTRRLYEFDKNSNRTAKKTATGNPGAECPTSGDIVQTHTYDSADRLVDTGYTYDALGRTTALPGGRTVGYFTNDKARELVGNGKRQTWTLDAAHRYRSWTVETNVSGTWQPSQAKLNHYGADGDSPRWTVENGAGDVIRNVTSVSGKLVANTGSSGGTALLLTNLHGDVNLVLPLTGGESPTVVVMDEYGVVAAETKPRYGWLGDRQRNAETVTDMILMGARIYDPGTGRFLSRDPIEGGNSNSYIYPADPINFLDADGQAAVVLLPVAAGTLAVLAVAVIILLVLWVIAYYCYVAGCTIAVPRIRPKVPWPGKLTRKSLTDKRPYIGYMIHYYGRIWKYGISSVGASRPASQISTCNRYYGVSSGCRYTIIRWGLRGWYNARRWEAAQILKYVARHWHCPPGQYDSCR
ncbi:DNRLRE domain-containing protein [Micromonospora pattaloongensis]|nr:DNRLRE domain-containing protein [Micromonospora pattaloongensis]